MRPWRPRPAVRAAALAALLAAAPHAGGAEAAAQAAPAPEGPAGVPESPAVPDAAAEFRSGRELVARNTGDAPRASREELEEGVRRVRSALHHGYPEAQEAWRTLAQAYDALRLRVDAQAADAAAFHEREGECYRRLAELDPRSAPEWLLRYVATVAARRAQLSELRALVRTHPRHLPARKVLASRLCEDGNRAEGLHHAAAAARQVASGKDRGDADDLLAAAWRCGGAEGARQIQHILERGAGGPLR